MPLLLLLTYLARMLYNSHNLFFFFFLTDIFKEKVVNTEKVLNQVKETQSLGGGFS